jgi:acetylglutamate kinase
MKPVVVKFGGELLEEPRRVMALASAVARLTSKGSRTPLVLVHGGGREIDAALARVGIEKRQVEGLRITDEPTLEIVVSVLAGLVNTRFVAALGAAGVRAVGLTGADATIGRVRRAAPHRTTKGDVVDLGQVGDPIGRGVPKLLIDLCRGGYVPVLCSVGASEDGALFNVNADVLAAHLAGRLGSPRLIVAGATSGVLDPGGATIPALTFGEIDRLVERGGATAGMIAKLAACRAAIDGGAKEVFVADGRDPGRLALLASRKAVDVAGSTKIHKGSRTTVRKSRNRLRK